MRYTDPNSYADNPGSIKLSPFKLRKIKKLICMTRREKEYFKKRIPAVREYVCAQLEKERKEGRLSLLVLEAALLIEEHYDEICDELENSRLIL